MLNFRAKMSTFVLKWSEHCDHQHLNAMKYKVLATMMAVLGFGASCSSTRQHKGADQPEEQPVAQQDTVEVPQIRLMYGVPPAAFRMEAIKSAPEQPTPSQNEQTENPLKVIDNE